MKKTYALKGKKYLPKEIELIKPIIYHISRESRFDKFTYHSIFLYQCPYCNRFTHAYFKYFGRGSVLDRIDYDCEHYREILPNYKHHFAKFEKLPREGITISGDDICVICNKRRDEHNRDTHRFEDKKGVINYDS